MVVIVFDDEGAVGEVYSDRSDEDVRMMDSNVPSEEVEEFVKKHNLKLVYNG